MNKEIFDKFPILESERISIRQMLPNDVDVIYNFNSCEESLKHIVREPFKTKDEAVEKLFFFLSGNQKKEAFWWVFTLKETGEDIGYGGLFDIAQVHGRAEIGYGLIKEFWGKGYMSEIVGTILQFGIEKAKLHKIYGVVIPGNIASVRLLEKRGFVKEAHLKGHSFARGKYFDEMMYSFINVQ